jgi:hypothetical protein
VLRQISLRAIYTDLAVLQWVAQLVSKVFRLLLESKLVDPNERSNLKLGCTLIQLVCLNC